MRAPAPGVVPIIEPLRFVLDAIKPEDSSAGVPKLDRLGQWPTTEWSLSLSRVLRFHRVQSRQSENRWRLDRPYCGGDCCNIPCLVDAATLCAVVPAAMLVITKSVDTPGASSECNGDIKQLRTDTRSTSVLRRLDRMDRFRNRVLILRQRQYKRPECFVLLQLENGVVLGGIGH